jgi:hypothetical protein
MKGLVSMLGTVASRVVLAGLSVCGCTGKPASIHAEPVTMPATMPTPVTTVTPIDFPPSPYGGHVFVIEANIDSFETLGFDDPLAKFTGGMAKRGIAANTDGIQCFRVGPDREAIAMYDPEYMTSIVLTFKSSKPSKSVTAKSTDVSWDAWLLRHTATSQEEYETRKCDPEKLQAFWVEFLQSPIEVRQQRRDCFPLVGDFNFKLAPNSFVLSGEVTLSTKKPLPSFDQWLEFAEQSQNHKVENQIADKSKSAADGKAEMNQADKDLQAVKGTSAHRNCVMDGIVHSTYANQHPPVMP